MSSNDHKKVILTIYELLLRIVELLINCKLELNSANIHNGFTTAQNNESRSICTNQLEFELIEDNSSREREVELEKKREQEDASKDIIKTLAFIKHIKIVK